MELQKKEIYMKVLMIYVPMECQKGELLKAIVIILPTDDI